MLQQNERMALYFWFKVRGACDRAKVVFDDPQVLYQSDIDWLLDVCSWMTREMVLVALEYIPDDLIPDYMHGVALTLADQWCWHEASPSDRQHYNSLRWDYKTGLSGSYQDDDLPF